MSINPIAALASFVSKATTVLPKAFTNSDQELAMTTHDEMSGMAKWMQQEKFMNFAGMQVPVPPGFNTYVLDHVQRLENVWDTLQTILPGVLNPVDKQLGRFTHDLGMLTVPVGFRYKDFKFPLKTVEPSDLIKKLASSYLPNVVDQRVIEKTYHSAGEIDVAFNRVRALHADITKKVRKDINRLIASISTSVDIISDNPVDPQVAQQITLMVDAASNWIELFGLFMKQTDELVNSLNATAEKLKALRSNKK